MGQESSEEADAAVAASAATGGAGFVSIIAIFCDWLCCEENGEVSRGALTVFETEVLVTLCFSGAALAGNNQHRSDDNLWPVFLFLLI